jgi:Xaa-Pro aminopeptidase
MLEEGGMGLSDDDRALLAARRASILAAMGDGVMLLPAATELIRSGDTHFPFRQDSDFGYVTGFPEPDAVAVLAVGAANPYALFVRPRDPEQAVWVGPRAGVEGAVADYDANVAYLLGDLEKELLAWLGKANQVFLPFGRDDALTRRLHTLIRYANAQRPRTGAGPTVMRDAGEILHELRLTKSPAEVTRLRETIAIAAEAHREAMRTVRPGMHEYEVEALIDGIFRRRGASGPAYPSIVASGANATILHYTANDRPLGADELLLIDAGSERAGYCADVTRTFPTGWRYSPAQRDLYDAVLAAQLAAIGAARPGTTLDALHATATRVLSEALIALRLLEGSVDEVVEQEKYKRFYMHRTSHWLGRDVHDVGQYKLGDTPRALEPGMVFTVEPGLYVPADADDVAEPFRGIGIRIEDDVLVTPGGVEVLSAAVPKHVEEIETLRAVARA